MPQMPQVPQTPLPLAATSDVKWHDWPFSVAIVRSRIAEHQGRARPVVVQQSDYEQA